MDIFLQNSIISDTSLSDQEIAVYTALRSLYVSAQVKALFENLLL